MRALLLFLAAASGRTLLGIEAIETDICVVVGGKEDGEEKKSFYQVASRSRPAAAPLVGSLFRVCALRRTVVPSSISRDTRRSRYFAGKFDLFLCGRSLNFADSYLVVKRYAIKHEQVSQSNIYFFDSKVLILIYVFSFKNSATLQISLSLRGRIIFGKTFLFSEISSYLKESGALDNSEKYPAFPTVCLSIGLLAG